MPAELKIDFTLDVDGAPTAADALPELRDAASTYGVKRLDTGAVVVAAGTPMTAEAATGRYTFVIPSPIAGVRYAYVMRFLVDGTPISVPGELGLSPAAPTLPSYLTVEQTRTYLAGMPGVAALKAATDEQLAQLLPIGSMRVDNSGRWQGGKLDAAQDLEFPRDCVAAVPINVKLAVIYECDSMLAGVGQQASAAAAAGIKREKTGDAEIEYFEPKTAGGQAQLCSEAAALVARFRLRSGRIL